MKILYAMLPGVLVLGWLTVSSISANPDLASNGTLGSYIGGIFALIVLLGPLFYVVLAKIKVKNVKPLFVEPSIWVAFPLFAVASFAVFIIYALLLITPPLAFLQNEMENDTFIGVAFVLFMIITTMFGPIIAASIYWHTHFQKIVGYNTPEWRAIRAERKGSKNKQ